MKPAMPSRAVAVTGLTIALAQRGSMRRRTAPEKCLFEAALELLWGEVQFLGAVETMVVEIARTR